MHRRGHFPNLIFGASLRPESAALAILLMLLFLLFVFLFMTFTAQPAQAQTYQVIHQFTGADDGLQPSNLVLDRGGNLFGTAGGPPGGIVFRLTPRESGWIFSTVHEFNGNNDGNYPDGLVLAPDGSLYGTTWVGGTGGGAGTVFNLRPFGTPCRVAQCGWSETVLYSFGGFSDGSQPMDGVLLDPSGVIFGTASRGGKTDGNCAEWGCGTVYELTPNPPFGWAETTLYTFQGTPDGGGPSVTLVRDKEGNLYGTTGGGGDYGYGTVFELSPQGDQWTEKILHSFGYSDGGPLSRLILDPSGNLYGTTVQSVFVLSPSYGGWSFSNIYSADGGILYALAMDATGNLLGVNGSGGAYGCGLVYKLAKSDGGWAYSDMHDLAGGWEGCWPASLAVSPDGRIFGAAAQQGEYRCKGYGSTGCGAVFEITP